MHKNTSQHFQTGGGKSHDCKQRVSYAPEHSPRQIGLAVAAAVTVERAQLIGRVNMARLDNCDTHAVDGRG